jgi:hypothetical protein
MGIVRSIARTHGLISVVITGVCIGVSAWGLMASIVPMAESMLNEMADNYDVYIPEITIENGQASIRQEQPYFIDAFKDEKTVFAIDTRKGKFKEAINYLKDVQSGAVLSRDSIILKNGRQTRIVPLKEFPNITLNSTEIHLLISEYLPVVEHWVWGFVLIYFIFVKPIQILILSMIPYFGARSYSVDLTYGEALKVATFAMVPPVLLVLFLNLFSTWISGSFVLYFALYIGLLIFSVWELVKSNQSIRTPDTGIYSS